MLYFFIRRRRRQNAGNRICDAADTVTDPGADQTAYRTDRGTNGFHADRSRSGREKYGPYGSGGSGKDQRSRNQVFAALEQSPKDAILLKEGLDFYGWLNDKEESWLQLFDFSHEEIRAGVRDLAVLMGQSVMADLVLDE